jgi:protein gp37
MGTTTTIAWTDHTFNLWWGCTKISPGCDHCYAEAHDRRVGFDNWGVVKPRRHIREKTWQQPLQWNERPARADRPARVFSASMADILDNEVGQHHRERLWAVIRETPHRIWQIVTKRIGKCGEDAAERDWGNGYSNAWLITDHRHSGRSRS